MVTGVQQELVTSYIVPLQVMLQCIQMVQGALVRRVTGCAHKTRVTTERNYYKTKACFVQASESNRPESVRKQRVAFDAQESLRRKARKGVMSRREERR